MLSINRQRNTGFCGLKANVEESRMLLSEMKVSIGNYVSPSYLNLKLCRTAGNPELEWDKRRKITWAICKLARKINHLREERDFTVWDKSLSIGESHSILKDLIMQHRVANCGELADLLQLEHFFKRIEAHRLSVLFYEKDGNHKIKFDDHAFVLRGLDRKAEIAKPETWGPQAIIADGWLNLVARATDRPIATFKGKEKVKGEFFEGGFTQILNFFGYNPKKHIFVITESNKPYAENFLKRTDLRK